jgi:hypothetical protein
MAPKFAFICKIHFLEDKKHTLQFCQIYKMLGDCKAALLGVLITI